MKLNAKKLYFVLLGIIVLTLAALFMCVYGANTVLQGKSKDVYDARKQSLVLDNEQRQLTKAKADIDKYQSLANIAKSIVPQDKNQAQTVREIVSIAAANGVRLGSITFPSSSLGDPKTPLSQLSPVKNIPGVYSLLITVQSDAAALPNFNSFINLLTALEHNRRTALVSGITLSPDAANASKLSFTLTLNEYIKP